MTKPTGCLSKILLLIVIIVVAAAAAPLVSLSPLKGEVAARLSDSLGRSVTVDSVRLKLIGGPYLDLAGMTVHEDPQFGDGVFLKANKVRAGLDVMSYLRTRQIVINSIAMESPQIDLVKNNNGVWSWTTLGKKPQPQSTSSALLHSVISQLPILSLALAGDVSTTALRTIKIDNGTVRLIDRTESASSEASYKNISLNASIAPYADGETRGTEVKGDLLAASEKTDEADSLKATLPFDLRIVGDSSALMVSGSIGPGSIETKNLSIDSLGVDGQITSNKDTPLTGNGKISVTDLVIHTVNLSERVANALRLEQIGDMSPGTSVASLEADFRISQGVVTTTGLQAQQLDGLGDATAPNGSFRIDSALSVNYAATVVLSPEATARVKTVSPTLGLFVTILETNNRVSVPINISGDVRNPEVQVDVSRIF